MIEMAGMLALLTLAVGGGQLPDQPPAPVASPSAAPDQRPGFSGRWRLNPDQSEDARQKWRDALAGRRNGGGRGGGGSGGRGGGGRGSGGRLPAAGDGRERGHPPGDGRDSIRDYMRAPAELMVTQTATEIAVLDPDGLLRLLHPDGQAYKTDSGSEVRTRWEGDRLVVQTKLAQGARITETLSLGKDKRQLVVALRYESQRGELTVRRVYDAGPGEAVPSPTGRPVARSRSPQHPVYSACFRRRGCYLRASMA